jgi:signal transduction histidine kinase
MARTPSLGAPRGSRVVLLVAVLLLTLGLVAVLAFEAYRADRSHRQVTEQVLQDYVRFAALELARHASRELDAHATTLLDALACGAPERSAARALAQLETGGCGSCGRAAPAAYVRFDPGDGQIVDAVGDLDPAALAQIERLLAGIPRGRLGGLAAVGTSGRPLLIAWRNYGAAAAVEVHAIVVPEATLAAIVDQTIESRPLLPKALVEPGAQRAYLKAELRLTEGGPWVGGGGNPASSFSAEEPLESAFGGDVRVVASLAAGAADSLIIGGLPRSRLPLLAALLCIGAGLFAVAVYQLRREHELARLRDAFVSGVSHELRTPLAQIRLFAETLRMGRVRSAEETERSLAILDEEAVRLSHMVDNVLAFSRAGRMTTDLTLAPLPLAPFVAETVERFAPLGREHCNRFAVEIPRGLEVQGDRDAMTRILTNLLENAVKYGREGQTVRISAVEEEGRVRLIVDDEGSGVQHADRSRIWEPYVRGAHRGVAATGTGIGLSVVRDLTVAMGGNAWADDAPAGGGRFVIELPAAVQPGAQGSPLEPSGAPA